MANRQFFASQMSEVDRPQIINYQNYNPPHLENYTSMHPRNDTPVSGMNSAAYLTASRPNNYPPVGFSSEVPIHGAVNSGILHNPRLHQSSGSSNQFRSNHFLHVPSSYGQPTIRDRSSTANVVAENERMEFRRKSPFLPSISDSEHSGEYYCVGTSSNLHSSSVHLQPRPMPGPRPNPVNPNSSITSYQSNSIAGEVFHRNVRSRPSHALHLESHPSGASSNLTYNFHPTNISRPNVRSHQSHAFHSETRPSGAFSSSNLPYNFHSTTHISHPSVAEHRLNSRENSSGLNMAGAHLHTMTNLSCSSGPHNGHPTTHISHPSVAEHRLNSREYRSGLNVVGAYLHTMANLSSGPHNGHPTTHISHPSAAEHRLNSRENNSGLNVAGAHLHAMANLSGSNVADHHFHSMQHISGLNAIGHHRHSMASISVPNVAGPCSRSSEDMSLHSRIPYSDSFYYEMNQFPVGSSVLDGAVDTAYNSRLAQSRNAINLLPTHHCASTHGVEMGFGSFNQEATSYMAIPSGPPMGIGAPSLEDVGPSSPQAVTSSRRSRPLSITRRRLERNGTAEDYYDRLQEFSYDDYAYARWLSEAVVMLEPLLFDDYIELFDQHTNMRLDIDGMSYEELLALQESIGNVSTGLSEGSISRCLMETIHCSSVPVKDDEEDRTCMICLEEYKEGEKLGRLKCRHDFHASCIRKWLVEKNACPICKTPALSDAAKEKQVVSL